MYIHICVRANVCTCIYGCVKVCVGTMAWILHLYFRAHINMCVIFMYECVCVGVCVCVYVFVGACICAYVCF